MGMSTYIIGLRTKDDPVYQAHLAVVNACKQAKIVELPKETAQYMGCTYTDDVNVEEVLEVKIPKIEWSDRDMQEGYEIKVNEIPQGVDVIRFINAY